MKNSYLKSLANFMGAALCGVFIYFVLLHYNPSPEADFMLSPESLTTTKSVVVIEEEDNKATETKGFKEPPDRSLLPLP